MKKGFTLIELLAVMVVLGIIMLVAVPSITNSLSKRKNNEYKDIVDNFILSAENYIETNFEKFSHLTISGNKTAVELQELIDNGYLKEPLINPNTKQSFDLKNVVIATVESDKTLSYEFKEENLGINSYIVHNLQVWYDGFEEPTNRIWRDKSSQNNYGNIIGGKFTNTYWRSSDQGNVIKTKNSVSLGNNFTYEIIVDNVTAIGNSTLSGMISIPGSYVLGLGGTISSPSIKAMASANDTINSISVIEIPKYITMVVENTNISIYTNGELNQTFNSAQDLTTVSNKVAIGQYSINSKNVAADYYSIRVYNAALSATEVLNNYKIDVLRYGE